MKKIIKAEQLVVNNRALLLWNGGYSKGHYLPILESAVNQLDAMLSYYNKVLVYRLDFRLHVASDSNAPMSEFIRRYRKFLNRYGVKRLGYLWCREQATSDKQHYHCIFLVDTNLHQRPHKFIELAEHYWETWEQGSMFTPKNCYKLVRRDDMAAYQDAFNRMSYLAKVVTKDKRPPSTNDYSSSRLKIKENK